MFRSPLFLGIDCGVWACRFPLVVCSLFIWDGPYYVAICAKLFRTYLILGQDQRGDRKMLDLPSAQF